MIDYGQHRKSTARRLIIGNDIEKNLTRDCPVCRLRISFAFDRRHIRQAIQGQTKCLANRGCGRNALLNPKLRDQRLTTLDTCAAFCTL